MAVLKDEEKSKSRPSNLDDTWHMENNEGNTQDFEDEGNISSDEYFEEELTDNIGTGFHVSHVEKEKELQ